MKYNLIYLLILLLLPGCSSEENSETNTGQQTTFQLQLTTRADSNALTYEQSVKRVRLMMYDAAGKLEANKLFEGDDLQTPMGIPEDPSVEGEYRIETTLTITAGQKTFIIVGNETNEMQAELNDPDKAHSLSVVKGGSIRWKNRPTAPLVEDEMMFTSVEEIYIAPGKREIELDLKRGVQRVDVKIDNQSSQTFTLIESKIVKTPQWSPLIEPATPTSFTADELETVIISDTETDWAIAETKALPSVYLFEHAPTVEADLTALSITFKQGNGNSLTLPPLPLLGQEAPEAYYVKRNRLLKLTLTVEDDGFTFECVNWIVEDYDIDSGGKQTTVKFKFETSEYWNDGEPLDQDGWNNQEWEIIL